MELTNYYFSFAWLLAYLNNVFLNETQKAFVCNFRSSTYAYSKKSLSHQSNCNLDEPPNLALSDGCHGNGRAHVCK